MATKKPTPKPAAKPTKAAKPAKPAKPAIPTKAEKQPSLPAMSAAPEVSADKKEKDRFRTDVETVKISELKPYYEINSRNQYDQDAIDQLAESIKEVGLLQPIGITPDKLIVLGNRRFYACRKLGYETIPAVIMRVEARDAALRNLVENVQREQLAPHELALSFRKVQDEYSYSGSQISQATGMSKANVNKYIRLTKDLAPVVFEGLATFHRHANVLSFCFKLCEEKDHTVQIEKWNAFINGAQDKSPKTEEEKEKKEKKKRLKTIPDLIAQIESRPDVGHEQVDRREAWLEILAYLNGEIDNPIPEEQGK